MLIPCAIAALVIVPASHARETAQAVPKCYTKTIAQHRTQTQELRKIMGLNPHHTSRTELKSHSCRYHNWVLKLWKKRATVTWKRWLNPPHKVQWLCIHKYEGSWTDPNSPFYGGLQMDYGFQQTYGLDLLRSKGTADHWTPLEQMWVAERAYKTRGFYPWPNTARFCHLI